LSAEGTSEINNGALDFVFKIFSSEGTSDINDESDLAGVSGIKDASDFALTNP
jgi:hypothetical protein